MPSPIKPLKQGEYATNASYSSFLGEVKEGDDADEFNGAYVLNSPAKRELMFVQNGSGSAINTATALKWVSGQYQQQVQPATNGGPIRGISPYMIGGSQTLTIPAGAYFYMVIGGPTTVMTDGTAITAEDQLIVGAATGKVKTNNASPTANVTVIGGTAMAAAPAIGTGTQKYVRIDVQQYPY